MSLGVEQAQRSTEVKAIVKNRSFIALYLPLLFEEDLICFSVTKLQFYLKGNSHSMSDTTFRLQSYDFFPLFSRNQRFLFTKERKIALKNGIFTMRNIEE